jgi:phytoene dehydrogenase-like protein
MRPSRAILALHAGVYGHYREGGWYPRGGGGGLADAFCRAIRASGGAVRMRSRVDRILVERRNVLGVRLTDGTEIRAREVVSNADPDVTFRFLVEKEEVPGCIRRKLRRTKWSSAAVIVFFTLDADARALGLDSGNYWLSPAPGTRLDASALGSPSDPRAGEGSPWVFLSVSSLKDPTAFDGRLHTCEAFAFVPFDVFSRFEGTTHGNRPAEYEALKTQIADEVMATIERHLPGLKGHVVLREVGSPLTGAYYCESTHGACYGTEKSLWQLGPFAWREATPLRGLTLGGASTLAHGVHGAVQSGLRAAGHILHCPPADLLRSGQPKIKTYLADEPADWPEDLQSRFAAH